MQKNHGALPRSGGQDVTGEEKRLRTVLCRMMRMCERGQLPKDIAKEPWRTPKIRWTRRDWRRETAAYRPLPHDADVRARAAAKRYCKRTMAHSQDPVDKT